MSATIPEGVCYGCTKLERINIGDTNTVNIKRQAFCGCHNLSQLGSLYYVEDIGVKAFYECFSIATISLPSITNIDDSAFSSCTGLRKITIGSGITNIGIQAFANCTSLIEVTISATTPPSLGSSAFSNTPSNLVIKVPSGYGETYKAATGWSTYADYITEVS